jgi:hypothetical protein
MFRLLLFALANPGAVLGFTETSMALSLSGFKVEEAGPGTPP